MKHHLWSKLGRNWEGFEPISYWLNLKVLELPLVLEAEGLEKPTTVDELFGDLKTQNVRAENHILHHTLITANGSEIIIKGPDFNRQILVLMLQFVADGIDPFVTKWHYFDHDDCMNDPHSIYSFFVVHNDEIVRKQIRFSDYFNSGFDPFLFDHGEDIEATWDNEKA